MDYASIDAIRHNVVPILLASTPYIARWLVPLIDRSLESSVSHIELHPFDLFDEIESIVPLNHARNGDKQLISAVAWFYVNYPHSKHCLAESLTIIGRVDLANRFFPDVRLHLNSLLTRWNILVSNMLRTKSVLGLSDLYLYRKLINISFYTFTHYILTHESQPTQDLQSKEFWPISATILNCWMRIQSTLFRSQA